MSSVAGLSVSEFRKLFELFTAFCPQATSKGVGSPLGSDPESPLGPVLASLVLSLG